MRRRAFLELALAAPAALRALRQEPSQPWRTFEVRVRLEVLGASGTTRAWLPLPLTRAAAYQRNLGHVWRTNASACRVWRDPKYSAAIFCAEWPSGEAAPTLDLTMTVAMRNVRVALDRPSVSRTRENVTLYLEPTALIPTDGIVRETAQKITSAHRTELARARAIYDWIVENTFRDPAVRGCGLGDIRWMLETKSLGGKCADVNTLFVGLARASGLPARDLYGIRVGPSAEFPSLGTSGAITSAQHCRAEVFLRDFGWVPVDPADVRKVAFEERPAAPLSDPYLQRVRDRLFGGWEMNWIAFNDAHDVALPGSAGRPLPFFMYPQAEVAGNRKDSLDPERFRYEITATEL